MKKGAIHFSLEATVENQRYDCLQNKSNSTADAVQVEENLQGQLSDGSVFRVVSFI